MAGPRIPTDVKPNKFVEANGYAREVVENTFRFSLKNLGKFAIFGIAVPVLIYKGCVQEFVSAPPPSRYRDPRGRSKAASGARNLRRRPTRRRRSFTRVRSTTGRLRRRRRAPLAPARREP